MRVTFAVPFPPSPQGSKDALGRESSKGVKPYREAVALFARGAARGGQFPLTEDPVEVNVSFVFGRPPSHYLPDQTLKSGAPLYPAHQGDLDKFCRAVGDALQGVLVKDDRQIVKWVAQKHYGSDLMERGNTYITVRTVHP